MRINLHLDDQIAKELDLAAKELDEPRGALIRKALREWLNMKSLGCPAWPPVILEWKGAPEMPPFETYRDELLP
jgi:hypothetical protein